MGDKMEIILPTQVEKATKVNPESLILFGLPKCGKTTAVSELKDCLLIDIEGGAGFVDALKMEVNRDFGPVAKYNWLKQVANKIKESGRPYKYVAIDTISYIDELSEWVGTWNYMNSPQGTSFNRVKVNGIPVKGGEFLKPDNPDYQSVHNLPEGYGYRWSRQAMLEMFDITKHLGSVCTISVCHVLDKYVFSKLTNTEVRVMDLSLTGRLKGIIARDVDAIGYVYNEDGKLMISFKGNEERTGGIRGNKHIQGYEGVLEWDKIFV